MSGRADSGVPRPLHGPFAQACEHRVGLVDLVADGAEIGADRAEIGARATRRTC